MALALVEQMGPSGYAVLPPGVVLEDRTGQAAVGAELLSLEGLIPVARLELPTGDPGLQMSLVGVLLGSRDLRRTITSYRTPLIVEAPASVSVVGIDDDFPRLNLVVRTRLVEAGPVLDRPRVAPQIIRASEPGPATGRRAEIGAATRGGRASPPGFRVSENASSLRLRRA